MKRDPKQIVTPYAFDVHPDLLGLPLATPKRRFAALMLDLIFASILSALGNIVLALASTAVFFWIALRTKNDVLWQNILRYSGAAVASLFIFALTLGLLEGTDSPDPENLENIAVLSADDAEVDWEEFASKMATTNFSNPDDIAALEAYAERMEENALQGSDTEITSTRFDSLSMAQLIAFYEAVTSRDSVQSDSLRPLVAANIAAPELSSLENLNDIFEERIDDLEDENEDLREEVENPGFLRSVRAAGDDLGLTIGWVGIYFILSLALFQGRTLGKKLLGLKVIRLNNKPIGIWYSFERFGGYAAGFATGLLGFFQVYWDPNRQAIHDKIASTVVVDVRNKKIRKFEKLSKQVRADENLLDED